METLCVIRDMYRTIMEFESKFQETHNLCFNEGMLLCSLKDDQYSAGELAKLLGLSNSNVSKVIRSVEKKGLIERVLSDEDKRIMFFKLSQKGIKNLDAIDCNVDDLPDQLKAMVEMNRIYMLSVK